MHCSLLGLDRIGACTECLSAICPPPLRESMFRIGHSVPQYSLGLRHSSRSVGSALHQCLHRSCPGPTTLWDNRALGSGRAGSHCLSLLRRSCSPKTSGAGAGAGVLGGVPPTNTRKNQNKRRGCAATAHAAERAGGTCRNVYQPRHHTSPDWEHARLSPAAAVLGYPCSFLTSLGVQHTRRAPQNKGPAN